MFSGHGAYCINTRAVYTAWELRGFPLHGKQLRGGLTSPRFVERETSPLITHVGRCAGCAPAVTPEDSPRDAEMGRTLMMLSAFLQFNRS